jgi:hypothetical protein
MGERTGAYVGLEAQPQYMFGSQFSGPVVREAKLKGAHGWPPTNPDMLAAFIITGPDIAIGKVIEQVQTKNRERKRKMNPSIHR